MVIRVYATIVMAQFSTEKKFSKYFGDLDDPSKARYKEKLSMVGNKDDPYLETSSASANELDWQDWPNVKYPIFITILLPHQVLIPKIS